MVVNSIKGWNILAACREFSSDDEVHWSQFVVQRELAACNRNMSIKLRRKYIVRHSKNFITGSFTNNNNYSVQLSLSTNPCRVCSVTKIKSCINMVFVLWHSVLKGSCLMIVNVFIWRKDFIWNAFIWTREQRNYLDSTHFKEFASASHWVTDSLSENAQFVWIWIQNSKVLHCRRS